MQRLLAEVAVRADIFHLQIHDGRRARKAPDSQHQGFENLLVRVRVWLVWVHRTLVVFVGVLVVPATYCMTTFTNKPLGR